ncbi:MAG: 16S rRNA (guanine(966)-N(2))-methyltransferase RsmD [Planctomycetes bacterium]|nr:16S rRNA (guanine(966)-N(2))-methyltransferase RsmD [Planctomycetota bacterium]
MLSRLDIGHRIFMTKGGIYLTGGSAKGARLFSVPGADIRPALARMRISVFEIMRSRVEGACAADLFAGSGSLGLEALSRGAAFCAFIERDARCLDAVQRNVAKLKFRERAAILRGDALEAAVLLARLDRRFDLIFVDPPYALYDDVQGGPRLEEAVADLNRSGLLADGSWIVVEHRTGRDLGDVWAGAGRIDRRRYGGTTVSWYTGFQGGTPHGSGAGPASQVDR